MKRRGWGITLLVSFAVASACGGRAATDPNGTGSAGSAGTAGGAGASSALCSLPQAPGGCRGYQPSFWHDPKTGLCEPFNYSGCDGNANRFATQAECIAACPGGGSEWGACQRDSDCQIRAPGCCGQCEPLGAEQLYAINSQHAAEEYEAMCPESPPCVACPEPGELEATGKYFVPRCTAGQCSVVDIRTSAATECATPRDCMLREGSDCCQGCQSSFIAANRNANFCPDGPKPCPLCVSLPPEGLGTDCVAGRCTLTLD
jgi:hypothetical protein